MFAAAVARFDLTLEGKTDVVSADQHPNAVQPRAPVGILENAFVGFPNQVVPELKSFSRACFAPCYI